MANTLRDGVFAIHKPVGPSSAQILRDCQEVFNPSTFFAPAIQAEKERRAAESAHQLKRRRASKRPVQVKIGHGGTLDPLATGVLILGVGSGTKALQGFLDCTKTYEAVVLFGASTDTYDRAGRVLTHAPYQHVSRSAVEAALASFRGHIKQVPPLYSALKLQGKPLYEYAREGKPIPREIGARDVEVLSLELVEWHEPGAHPHRWPLEQAEPAERNLAQGVWYRKRQECAAAAEGGDQGKRTPDELREDDLAEQKYESMKRRFEQVQDALVADAEPSATNKRARRESLAASAKTRPEPMMAGALGALPRSGGGEGDGQQVASSSEPTANSGKGKGKGSKGKNADESTPRNSHRGSNLVPAAPDASLPPPWKDAGPAAATIRMTVTSGFYVRSLCHDLGEKVGSAALMAELVRVRQGAFELGGETCLEYEDLARGEEVWAPKVQRMLGLWAEGKEKREQGSKEEEE